MRKLLNIATAAALLLTPASVLAISQHKQDKLDNLMAKEQKVQDRIDAVNQKANGSPNAKQQARLARLDDRLADINNAEQKVKDRTNKSN